METQLHSPCPQNPTPADPAAVASSGTDVGVSAPGPSHRTRLLALCALALLSVVFPKLAFPAGFLTLIGFITKPRPAPLATWILLAGSALGSTVGMLRFALEDAIPGVVSGGRTAIGKQAVSFMRTIITAQDHARTNAALDVDDDGIGSALTLEELAGLQPLPTAGPLKEAPLAVTKERIVSTARGAAIQHAGYLFIVCVPTAEAWSTAASEARDYEAAERRYLVYGWPEALSPGAPMTVYFADEHERILLLDGSDGPSPRYVGTTRPPPCDAALTESDWKPWKDKAAREHLPGDPGRKHEAAEQ